MQFLALPGDKAVPGEAYSLQQGEVALFVADELAHMGVGHKEGFGAGAEKPAVADDGSQGGATAHKFAQSRMPRSGHDCVYEFGLRGQPHTDQGDLCAVEGCHTGRQGAHGLSEAPGRIGALTP